MISQADIEKIVGGYDKKSIQIGMLGSHTALDVCDGAKDENFKTVVVCQKGREKTYLKYKRIVDEPIVLDNFKQIMEIQEKLKQSNVIFVPNRSFSTYIGYDNIENKFLIPMFGSRMMLRTEERNIEKGQYYLLEKSGINFPKTFDSPKDIDRLVIVKVQEAKRKIERAFFTASTYDEYKKKADERIGKGLITQEDLNNSRIEEFVVGGLFNFNYFYSPLKDEVEFMGIDRRIQTNLDGILRLTADQQLEAKLVTRNIEIGHEGATIRESMIDKVLDIGQRFVECAKKEFPPGIIGPFALQGAVNADMEIYIFDISPRIPGSPIISTTSPYSKYCFGSSMSMGRRIAIEIKNAIKQDKLKEIVT